MGCVTTTQTDNQNRNLNAPQPPPHAPHAPHAPNAANQHWRQLEYPRARNEIISNPYSLHGMFNNVLFSF